MKGLFPIDKFKKIQTPFYYYDTDLLRQTLHAVTTEAKPVLAPAATPVLDST